MSYYRQAAISFGPPITRMVKLLIWANAATFVLTFLIEQTGWFYPTLWLGLRPYDVTHNLFLWQPFTYLFLHGGFFHILFNLFALWMFGSDLERTWGSSQFLFYYFLTGVGAGILDIVVHPSAITVTIGASGAIYGLLLAYGLHYPNRPIFLYFLIPVPAKYFVAILGVIAFLSALSGPGSGVSHVAHLGGMLFGFLYLRGDGMIYRLRLGYHEWRRARRRRQFEVYMRGHDKDDAGRWIN